MVHRVEYYCFFSGPQNPPEVSHSVSSRGYFDIRPAPTHSLSSDPFDLPQLSPWRKMLLFLYSILSPNRHHVVHSSAFLENRIPPIHRHGGNLAFTMAVCYWNLWLLLFQQFCRHKLGTSVCFLGRISFFSWPRLWIPLVVETVERNGSVFHDFRVLIQKGNVQNFRKGSVSEWLWRIDRLMVADLLLVTTKS